MHSLTKSICTCWRGQLSIYWLKQFISHHFWQLFAVCQCSNQRQLCCQYTILNYFELSDLKLFWNRRLRLDDHCCVRLGSRVEIKKCWSWRPMCMCLRVYAPMDQSTLVHVKDNKLIQKSMQRGISVMPIGGDHMTMLIWLPILGKQISHALLMPIAGDHMTHICTWLLSL